LNNGGFEYDRDFVLKSCLTVLDRGARYEVEKFRDGKTKEEIITEWERIAAQALIPLIYFRYHYPEKFKLAGGLQEYLLRTLIVFGGSPDNLIDKVVRCIRDAKDFVLPDVFGAIRADGRSLELTPEVLFERSSNTMDHEQSISFSIFGIRISTIHRHRTRTGRRSITYFRRVCLKRLRTLTLTVESVTCCITALSNATKLPTACFSPQLKKVSATRRIRRQPSGLRPTVSIARSSGLDTWTFT
jgi:hypothetical protein